MRRMPRRWRFWGWLAALLTVSALLAAVSAGPAAEPGETVDVAPWVYAFPVAIGLLAVALARMGLLEQRRYQTELTEAAARDAVLNDRLAIARDLHDVLSHGLGAITLRARVATRVAQSRPEEAHAALADIARLSASATSDLRGILAVLHDPGAPAPTTPAPSLADLPALLDQARDDGLTLTASGLDTRAQSLGAELVAYHAVREGLANVIRHAGPVRVSVIIARDHESLQVTVADEGRLIDWAPNPGAGHGLALLATRVAAAGGTLTHGAGAQGYTLHASIPDGADSDRGSGFAIGNGSDLRSGADDDGGHLR